MSYPSIKQFGISDNPLIDTPFVETQVGGGSPPPVYNYFLLLNNTPFGLLNGDNLLLLTPS